MLKAPPVALAPKDQKRGGWVIDYEERFEHTNLGKPAWQPDTYPDDGPFSDNGVYFQKKGIVPPKAYRISHPFSQTGWLTIESYSRSKETVFSDLVAVVDDPNGTTNRVLKLMSPAHTDATIIRPTQPLPERYRISLHIGYTNFGDGLGGRNGYNDNETGEPWLADVSAIRENGFYWLAILDATPRPHNNIWIHHHRKLVIDTDNHDEPWMEIYNGSHFIQSGSFPIMMFALDGTGKNRDRFGNPFLSWAAGAWQPSGEIRAVDAYKPNTWYQASIERNKSHYTLELSGDFRYGGVQVYRASIDAAAACVWHYNQVPLEPTSPCVDMRNAPSLDGSYPNWPAGVGWPDYFMFGDPHNNFYEGSVYYDDIKLDLWKEPS